MLLSFYHSGCNGVSNEENEKGAHDLLALLRSHGAGFLPISGSLRTEPSPERNIDSLGGICFLGVEHPDFEMDLGDTLRGRTTGSTNLSFISGSCACAKFSQHCPPQDASGWDQIANGLQQFGVRMYSSLRPDYCWMDELADKMWVDVGVRQFKYIYWFNVFGPKYVEHLGREFLLGAPGWKIEELEDGGVLFQPLESFLKWHTNPAAADEAIAYFRQKHPCIKRYLASPGSLPAEVSRIVKTDPSGKETVEYDRNAGGGKSNPKKRRKRSE
jgi:hypothetical protein